MLNSIFISVPLSVEWNTVLEYSRKLKLAGYQVNVWNRIDNYDQGAFDKSDAVLFILPDNKSHAVVSSDLPVGLRKEHSAAYNQRKKVFVGLVNSVGEFNIYNGKINSSLITAIQGTRNSIFGSHINDISQRALDKEKAAWNIALNSLYGKSGPIGLQGSIGDPGIQGFNAIDYDERLLLMM